MSEVKIGALCWNQYTDWPSLLEAGIRADRLGYDTLWTWDHLYPIVGDPHGPNYEGWLTITAWAQATEHVRIGLMVGANTFREPGPRRQDGHHARPHQQRARDPGHRRGLVRGEAHEAFGFEFGSGFPERLRWLGEALPIMRGMLDGTEPTAPAGSRYRAARGAQRSRRRSSAHLPICVGGGGEKVTLKLVAQYADMNNIGGGIEAVRRKEAILLRALRGGRPRPRGDRAHDRDRRRSSSATIGPRQSGSSGRRSSATGSPGPGRTSRSGRPRTWPRSWRRISRSATATWSPASRRPTTRSR